MSETIEAITETQLREQLIAAWGVAVGALFLSFIGQFEYYQTSAGDPGIFSTTLVAVIKGLLLVYMLIGLGLSIKANGANGANRR